MLRNYIMIAWRNLLKNRTYSIINIAGLTIGMVVAMLIALWIWDEVSYNKNFENVNHIARIKVNSTNAENIVTQDAVPIPLSGYLRAQYPSDFKRVALASWNQPRILAAGETKLSSSGMYVEPDFTRIFPLKMVEGNLDCLSDPSAIILNQSLAKAIFGSLDPLHQLIKIDNKQVLTVAGVYEDFPHNSEFNDVTFFSAWGSYLTRDWVRYAQTEWDEDSFQLFAQLQDNANVDQVSAKVKGGLRGHGRKDKPEVILHPMTKWHLYDEFRAGINTGGSIQIVWMFGTIGLFVLLLACINFMNLSTARSEKRAKEVGIRKAIGSLRNQLVIQFLSESVLIAFLSFLAATAILLVSLPWFNQLAGKEIRVDWGNGLFWLSAVTFTLLTGIIAGSYPAFYLSSFNSVKVLKGTFKAGRSAAIPRKVLVVLQFTISVALIICTIIIYQEIKFAKDRPLGYSKAGLLTVLMNTSDLYGHYDGIRNDLIRSGAAVNMAESSSPTTDVWNNQRKIVWKGKDPSLNAFFGMLSITHDFGRTIGWQIKEGRDLSRDFASDSNAMLINESAAQYMGLKHPIGEIVRRENSRGEVRSFVIVGVIRNMVMESPFAPIKPILYVMDYENANVIIVKVNPLLSLSTALPKIEAVFKKYNPNAPFAFTFADDEYAKKFAAQERVSGLATFFAVFAIFISCLGLFGLASFTVEQRTKEIGVRKVLGASVLTLWQLLSIDFVGLVFISFLIASPVAYLFMQRWLGHYPYRVQISGWVFIVTGFLAMAITLVTVSVQAVRGAMANPSKCLRAE